MKILRRLLFAPLLLSAWAFGQSTPPFAPLELPRWCFTTSSGAPLSGGKLYSFSAGTSSPLATYTDAGGAAQNVNPTILDTSGCVSIWLGPSLYKFQLTDSADVQQWSLDNVSNVGQILYAKAVLLNNGGNQQTVLGPLGAAYFVGTTVHTTSPGVRVNLLDPSTMLDTLNPPTVVTVPPANAGQEYDIPDPLSAKSNFVLSPNSNGGNNLDCTQAGITCKRQAFVYWEGAGCNNTTPALGWDTLATNAPTPLCFIGTNTQKGVLAFPSAATLLQQATAHNAAAGTIAIAYPNATGAHHLLVLAVVEDGTRTVTGCTDGTNAYTQAVTKQQGVYRTDIWYFNGDSAAITAGTSVTCTFSAAANSAIWWGEYDGILTAGMLDKTATNSNAGSASVSSGTTAGTSQNTELVLMAVGNAGNVAAVAQNGWNRHTSDANSTDVSINGQGLIQQATTTQSGTMTLGTSQAWAAAIATFKANVGGISQAQHHIVFPPWYLSSSPVNASMKWEVPYAPTGTVQVALAATLMCTTDGNTDDSNYTNGVVVNSNVPNSTANTLTTTNFANLFTTNGTGCGAGSLAHLKVARQRYNAADTYEGWVLMDGTEMDFGITR